MRGRIPVKNVGLRGVTVADTKICFIDGLKGILLYRGFRIEELALKSSFQETAYLLLHGSLPKRQALEGFNRDLAEAREVPGFIYRSFQGWPNGANPMAVLQASVPLLSMADPEAGEDTREANISKAVRIISGLPSLTAAWDRIRRGVVPLPPDKTLSHGAHFLYQLTGREPDEALVHALDVSLILQAEHSFSASTFACREVVSTTADIYAGVAAGIGALAGGLHGGANALVMETLLQMASRGLTREEVAAWVRRRLDNGERIMGMGHPVYKTADPRAAILKAEKTGHQRWYELLNWIEEESRAEFGRRGKSGINPNVDFYTGLLYAMMGIPTDLMTPVFAMALTAGWCAHIIEEKFADAQEKPVLYRPSADYVGDYCGEIGCVYEPLEKR